MMELIFDRGELSHVTSVRFNEGEFAMAKCTSLERRSPLRASYDRKRDNYLLLLYSRWRAITSASSQTHVQYVCKYLCVIPYATGE